MARFQWPKRTSAVLAFGPPLRNVELGSSLSAPGCAKPRKLCYIYADLHLRYVGEVRRTYPTQNVILGTSCVCIAILHPVVHISCQANNRDGRTSVLFCSSPVRFTQQPHSESRGPLSCVVTMRKVENCECLCKYKAKTA